MIEVIGIIGMIVGGVGIYLYLSMNYEIKNITRQIKELENVQTNQKIYVTSGNKAVRQLVIKINHLLAKQAKEEVTYIRKDKELRQMIANVSHDLRTPLTSIIGYLQLVQDQETLEVDKHRYMKIIKRRAESLQGLITSFYDLSRIEAKEYTIELKSINISTTICELLASFYNDFVDKNLEPHFEIDEKCPLIIGDEKSIERVINNLIQNCLKYATGTLNVKLYQQKEWVISEFTNDAPSLTEEDVERLFERFYTADRMRTGQSTGLGLAITRKLIEQMGHQIEAVLDDKKLTIRIQWRKVL